MIYADGTVSKKIEYCCEDKTEFVEELMKREAMTGIDSKNTITAQIKQLIVYEQQWVHWSEIEGLTGFRLGSEEE